MIKKLIFLFLFVPVSLYASLPYHQIQLPRDEGAHYKNIPYTFSNLMEWWYFNGVATSIKGRRISFDVALFNPAVNGTVLMTRPMLHIQVSDLDSKKAYGNERVYPFNSGKIALDQLSIDISNDFSLNKVVSSGGSYYHLKAVLHEGGDDIDLDILLKPNSDFFLINGNGLMPMQNDTNSYYYSIPHMEFSGKIQLNHEVFDIAKSMGDAWMDHQWGDFDVSQNGWEWFSVRLQNGLTANIFLIIDYMNKQVVDGLANIILPSGEKRFISYRDFFVMKSHYWHDADTDTDYPLSFYFDFPQLGLVFNSSARFAEQQIHGYWEGYTDVSASYMGEKLAGYSYAELVYNSPA